MLRALDLVHRWAGGLLGLLLAVIALSGILLVHKSLWIDLPGSTAGPLANAAEEAALAARVLDGARPGDYLVMPGPDVGLAQLVRPDGSGAYFNHGGEAVARWSSIWDRPELWLFDLHHHLLAGEVGEWVVGLAGLAIIMFVVSGAILWWRTRRTFRLRLWPARWTRPALLLHHRDLGIVVAPLLLLAALTGVMMIFRPVAGFVLAPLSSPDEIAAALAPPEAATGPIPLKPDWSSLIARAQSRFPGARLRIVSVPAQPGQMIAIRMKQSAEWLPNGRSTVWLDPRSGVMIEARDALAMPVGAQAYNMLYPLHAAKVGGLPYRLLMSAAGLALVVLGLFTSWTFWFRRRPRSSPPKGQTEVAFLPKAGPTV